MSSYPDISITNDFLTDHAALFSGWVEGVEWDQRMRGRKSAAFGVPFDEAPLSDAFPSDLQRIAGRVTARLGWAPNSCLLEYYPQRRSSKGMATEPVERLEPNTAIAVVSVGAPRVMVFERDDGSDVFGRELGPGSLMVMSIASQIGWRHAVPARAGVGPRISATFRRVVPDTAHAQTG